MGVQLSGLAEGQEISLEELFDKRVVIDTFNWMYQFLSIIRQPDGELLKDSKGRVTSHISGLFYRTVKLLDAGIWPIYVFDGKPPDFKRKTNDQRRDVRAEALREWKEALEKGDMERAKKYAQRSTTITSDMIEDGKDLLNAMGVPVIQAIGEGESLGSVIVKKDDAYAIATQDYDSLLFGSPRLVRNLSITGKRKRGTGYITINPQMILLKDVLEKLEISHEQLVILGILTGTDYNPGGIAGYGPKRALEIVKEKKTLDAVLKDVAWDFDASAEDIYEFFREPPEEGYEIDFRDVDEEKTVKILCDGHDFSEERITNTLKKLKEKSDQRSLNRWF